MIVKQNKSCFNGIYFVYIVSPLPPKGILYTLAFSLCQDIGTVTVDRGLDNVWHKLTFSAVFK